MKKAFLTILAFFFTTNFVAFASTYSDVPDNYKYADSIKAITEQGIVSGYEDGTFRPENYVNRAELLKIINEAFTNYRPNTNFQESCFKDVPARTWYTQYVCYSKEKNYVVGYPDGSFRPANGVSLVEALKIITNPFNYQTEVSTQTWYDGILKVSLENNLIPTNFIQPGQRVTRGQMAEMIVRIQEYSENGTNDFARNKVLTAVQPEYFDPLNSARYIELPVETQLDVPFTSQAPYGSWVPPYDEACEEASIIMVEHFINGAGISKEEARDEIINLTSWVKDKGMAVDISSDQMSYTTGNYFDLRTKVYTNDQVSIDNIKRLLAMGYPIVVPVAGRYIGNTHYAYPGPPYHVLVLTGYDQTHFYANDPGTQYGHHYTYDQQTFFNGIHDWAGSKDNVLDGQKAMLVIEDYR